MHASLAEESVVARDWSGTAPVRRTGRAREAGKRRGSKSQFARFCSEIDDKIEIFPDRPLGRD